MSRMTKAPLALLISGMLLGTSAYAEDKLTVVSWGGAFTKSQVEAYHKPFIKKNRCRDRIRGFQRRISRN